MHVISVFMQKQFCKANLYVNLQMPSLIVDLNNAKKITKLVHLWLDLLNCVFRPRNSSP